MKIKEVGCGLEGFLIAASGFFFGEEIERKRERSFVGVEGTDTA
jgi:hypothetical protein